jgi:hypothetical protein
VQNKYKASICRFLSWPKSWRTRQINKYVFQTQNPNTSVLLKTKTASTIWEITLSRMVPKAEGCMKRHYIFFLKSVAQCWAHHTHFDSINLIDNETILFRPSHMISNYLQKVRASRVVGHALVRVWTTAITETVYCTIIYLNL